jgi:asparagine synthase (glutamine-hydrolysing)
VGAIGGLLRLDGGPVATADVEAASRALAHRGPDGGSWVVGSAGLFQRRSWALPEERLEVSDFVLAGDLRLDDRETPAASDGALVLAAYERWGEACAGRLLGDFAFALWDARRGVLFCARDPFGVKPLYYVHLPGRLFAFATEIKALLAIPGVPRRLNEERVADYLAPLPDDGVSTFYRDVRRLAPGHALTAGREGVRIRAHWSPDPGRELRLGSDAAYAEGFRALFMEAVRARLRSAGPVGSLLSGGLDSSSVTCAAARLGAAEGRGPLPVFSAVFDEVRECDERPYIGSVLALGGLRSRFVHADGVSPLVDLERMLWHEDEPFQAFNLGMDWSLYRAAGEEGVRVLLEGFDGDTTVSHGLGFLGELFRSGRWARFFAESRGLSRQLGVPLREILVYGAIRPMAPRWARRAWRAIRGRRALEALVHPGFARRIGLDERARALSRPAGRTEREEHLRHLLHSGLSFGLEISDRAAAAFGVEPRFPFFDRRLVEFCLALPPGQKIRRGWTRLVLRGAMEGILPEKVRWRRDKADLGPSFYRGFLLFERERIEDVILRRPGAIEGYVDMPALREAYGIYSAGGGREEGHAVWRAITLALWLRASGAVP